MYHDKIALRYNPLTLDGDVDLFEWRHCGDSFTVEEEFERSDWLKAETQEACNSAHAVRECNVYIVCDMKQ